MRSDTQTQRTISWAQASRYFSRLGLPETLIHEITNALRTMVQDNGEIVIGEKTIQQVTGWAWTFSESELELLYSREALYISQYVNNLYISVDTPHESVLTSAIPTYSAGAKLAYICLTETISRMVYDALYGASSETCAQVS